MIGMCKKTKGHAPPCLFEQYCGTSGHYASGMCMEHGVIPGADASTTSYVPPPMDAARKALVDECQKVYMVVWHNSASPSHHGIAAVIAHLELIGWTAPAKVA